MSRHRQWSPIWGAFTATTVSAVYLIAGFSGYQLNRRARFLAPEAWTGSVIWWQVAAGAALIPVAYLLLAARSRRDRATPQPQIKTATD